MLNYQCQRLLCFPVDYSLDSYILFNILLAVLLQKILLFLEYLFESISYYLLCVSFDVLSNNIFRVFFFASLGRGGNNVKIGGVTGSRPLIEMWPF